MTTVPLSEAKSRLSELIDSVDRTHERVLITKNGRDTAILIAVDDLESIEATMELLADPAAQDRIRQAEAQIAAGQFVTGEELEATLARKRARR